MENASTPWLLLTGTTRERGSSLLRQPPQLNLLDLHSALTNHIRHYVNDCYICYYNLLLDNRQLLLEIMDYMAASLDRWANVTVR